MTFDRSVDPDIAQVQVQNKVQQALPRLPQAVQQQGLVVTKSNADFLMVLAVYDETDQAASGDISDFVVSNLQDAIGRLPGVGDMQVFGSQYAMRIWLDPSKLASYQLMPRDVIAAVQAQNTQVAAGQIGALPAAGNAAAERHGHRTFAADQRRGVPPHHRQDAARWLDRAAVGCGARRAGQRELRQHRAAQRPSGHRHGGAAGARRGCAAHVGAGARRGRAPVAQTFPPATATPSRRTAPTS